MRDYDEMIARMTEADGVRMASGQHIDASPIPRHEGCPARPYADVVAEIQEQGRNRDHIEAYAENRRRDRDAERYDADPWVDRRDQYER